MSKVYTYLNMGNSYKLGAAPSSYNNVVCSQLLQVKCWIFIHIELTRTLFSFSFLHLVLTPHSAITSTLPVHRTSGLWLGLSLKLLRIDCVFSYLQKTG